MISQQQEVKSSIKVIHCGRNYMFIARVNIYTPTHCMHLSNQPIMWLQCSAVVSGNVHTNLQNGEKCDLGYYDCGMIDGARHISISLTADLLGCSHTTVSIVCSERCNKEKNIHWAVVLLMEIPCWWERSTDNVQAGGKATVTQITSMWLVNRKTECTIRQMGNKQQQKTTSGSTFVS